MSARAWRGRKPGPHRDELRWSQAFNRAVRNPGKHVRAPGGILLIVDETVPFPVIELRGETTVRIVT